MRTLYLSIGILLSASALGQQLARPQVNQLLEKAVFETPAEASAAMGGGDTLAFFDFSSGDDFELTSETGSPQGAEWTLGAIDPAQRAYTQEVNSPSRENGYAWCSGITIILSGQTYGEVKTYMTSKNSLDLTNVSNASISLYQNYKPFNCDNTFIEFSGDGGTTWISQEVNASGGNVNGPLQVLFPAVVCNKPNVKIRFVWTACSNGPYGAGYGWQIDDLAVVETPNKELKMGSVLFDGASASSFFFHKQLPLSQAHMYEPLVQISNNGALIQNVTVTATVKKDGSFFGTYTNPTPIALAPRKDTTFGFNTFIPTEIGHYEVVYSIEGHTSDPENTPNNNSLFADFYITDKVYSDNDGIAWPTGSMWTAFRKGGVATAPFAEVSAAQGFQVWKAGEQAHSITTVFPSANGNPFTVGQSLYIDLYEFTDPSEFGSGYTTQSMSLISTLEYVVLDTDTTPTGAAAIYKHIKFDDAVDLNPGLYIATISAFGGSGIYNMPTYSASNRDVSGAIRGNITGGASETAYTGYSNINPFIKLNLSAADPATSVAERTSKAFKLEQNSPNPFNGTSVIRYSLEKNAAVSLSVTDLTGKVIKSVDAGTQSSGSHKFELNANEFTSGVYFYTLTVNGETSTKKLIIN